MPENRKHSIGDIMDFAATRVDIAGWQVYSWESLDGGSLVTGCVPAGIYVRGPRKGQPRFSHPDCKERRKVVVSSSEMDLAAESYETETGKCWNCKGGGKVFKSWSVDEGVSHRVCDRCNGTGEAPK